jgi:hypothetical protein
MIELEETLKFLTAKVKQKADEKQTTSELFKKLSKTTKPNKRHINI